MTAKQLDAMLKHWWKWLTSKKHRNRSRASKQAWAARKAKPKAVE